MVEIDRMCLITGVLSFQLPFFDSDSFPIFALQLIAQLELTLIEQQQDSDLHIWLVDFEGSRLWLKGEDYSQSCWLEVQRPEDSEVLAFLASIHGMK
ncbi:DUF3630 family protein [Thaumasiovibrio sp. DFM-14]|uniref:DUF3630 family protein n=1 Tax=Thaumasiovibrio sp. DFM-14 TaxID=3384792 RepID=UPI0039A29C39